MTFDVGPCFAGLSREGLLRRSRVPNPAAKEHAMKEVEKKDITSVPGGVMDPNGCTGDIIGPMTPFPPEPDYPQVPIVPVPAYQKC